MMLRSIVVSTKGTCSGNPGPGGYAARLRMGDRTKDVFDYCEKTTSNQMEFKALIGAMSALKAPCCIDVHTNSQILCNAIANLEARSQNGWHTKTGAKCANSDLLQKIYDLKHEGKHTLFYTHIEEDDPDMEAICKIARDQIKAFRSK